MTRSSQDGSDEALMLRVQAGDIDAYEELVFRWQGRLLLFCFQYYKNHHDAEDACQDVLRLLYRKSDKFQDSGRFEGWLLTLARNLCLSDLAKRGRRAEILGPSLPMEALESLMSETADPVQWLLDAQLRQWLHEQTGVLTEEERALLQDYIVDGLTLQEIAARRKRPLSSIHAHIGKIINSLKKRLIS